MREMMNIERVPSEEPFAEVGGILLGIIVAAANYRVAFWSLFGISLLT